MVDPVTLLMLGVTACYTVSSLSDKYAASTAKLRGNEFTFLMCASMSVLLLFTLPFQKISFDASLAAFAGVALTALCKLLEFKTSAAVLREMSAFELKAWLGITLFISYATDVFFGEAASVLKVCCLCLTAVGLVLIVRSDKKESVNYRKLILPLALYLLSKYGYGLVIRSFSGSASSVMLLMPALAVSALLVLPFTDLSSYAKKPKGTAVVLLARIPNTAGMLMENAVIAISLASFSLIQPLILVSLFLIGLARREESSRLNLAGSIICIIGAVGFRLV